ncbi:MAG: PA14 domain-containing protein, partial [Phycisphaerae bacterium]
GVYDFPEELVGFSFTCPPNAVRKEHLKLQREGSASPVEYQLSDVVESGGYLTSATVHFRSDLPRGSSRLFSLVHDPAYTAKFTRHVTLTANADGTAVIAANLQQLRVPADSAAASADPPPILGISRDGGATWIGGGSLLLPQGITLSSVRGTVVDQGPLFLRYRLLYTLHFFTLNCDGTWQVDLTVQHNEKHILVDELLSGFSVGEAAFWRLSFQKGLEPDSRLVMCNGGYNAGPRGQYCGAYDKDLRADGALPYQLGLYTANSYGVMRSTVFFNENGQNALIFALNRPRHWRTAARRVWSAVNAPENIYFYHRNGDSYARLALLGHERHWTLGLIPRDEVVISELPVTPSDQTRAQKKKPLRRYAVRKDLEGYPGESRGQFGAGPEVRLWQKLTDFSLNAYKDMVFDSDEPLAPYDPNGDKCTYDDYWMGSGFGNLRGYMYHLIQRYWDVSGSLQSAFGKRFELYANSRASWTAEQRRRIRSILIFAANFLVEDSFSPHASMMAGQPNFVFDAKGSIPMAVATFPNHPHAERWKSEFTRFWNEWLDVYTRRANPRLNTHGGRWTENIACYWVASLMRSFYPAEAMSRCCNTEIYDHPLFKDLVRWTLDGLAPSEGPCRRLVPIGAHARGDVEGERLRHAAELLQKSDPALAQQLLWCLTDGTEGTRPDLRSRLYTDYGAVMWYDAGGPHEAFLTIQQLNGSGYRWTGESNGALYYATKGQRWSWNGAEQNGDSFDINLIPLFNLDGKSLQAHKVDGLLYDFDFAQYYKAAGSNPAYPWRGVMMLRDDYLAVYDHVADPKAVGKFQWCNYEAFLRAEYFAQPDFTDLKATRVPRFRGAGGPLRWDWGNAAPLESMKPGPFSIRWTGMLMPATSDEYSILADVNAGDVARIWLNNQLAHDSAAGKSVQVRLTGNQFADLKVEFTHRTGPARISVKWGTGRLVPPNPRDTFNRLPMPQLYPVKAGAGDQLHIVAPKAHKVETKPYGAVIDGKEYVFSSAAEVKAADGPAIFIGTAGYAREGQVALFEGTKVGFRGLVVERISGEFGVSASKQADGTLAGRLVGRSGGTIRLTPPAGFDALHCQVKLDGAVVPHTLEGAAISFDVRIQQSDGTKSYTVEAAGRLR